MKTTLTRFIRSLIIFSAILGAACFILMFALPRIISPATPWMLLLFFLITLAVFYFGNKAFITRFSKFVNYYLSVSMLKMLLLLIFAAVYIYLEREDAIRFAVTLLVLFFGYLAFEVIWLLKLKTKE